MSDGQTGQQTEQGTANHGNGAQVASNPTTIPSDTSRNQTRNPPQPLAQLSQTYQQQRSPTTTSTTAHLQQHHHRQRQRQRSHNRHHHRQNHRHSYATSSRANNRNNNETQPCKFLCVECFSKVTSLCAVLILLGTMGLICIVTGTVLGVLHHVNNNFLTISVMFLGIGVLLGLVVLLGWKCTPAGHEPLHALFGIGAETTNRRQRRTHSSHNWHGGIIYPEFVNRPPPPSYYASAMEQYHESLLLEQRLHGNNSGGQSSPPPSYRSHSSNPAAAANGDTATSCDIPNSLPPSYRSNYSRHSRPPIPTDLQSLDPPPADFTTTEPITIVLETPATTVN